MIKLKIEPYCNNCNEFKPVASTSTMIQYAGTEVERRKVVNHDVMCEHQGRRREIYKSMKEQEGSD